MFKTKTVFSRLPDGSISKNQLRPVPDYNPFWTLENDMPHSICITTTKCYASSGFVYLDVLAEREVYQAEWNEFTADIRNLARWDGFDAVQVRKNVKLLSFTAPFTGIVWAPLIRYYYLKRRTKIEHRNLRAKQLRNARGVPESLNDIILRWNETFFRFRDLKVKLLIPLSPEPGSGVHGRLTVLIHEIDPVGWTLRSASIESESQARSTNDPEASSLALA